MGRLIDYSRLEYDPNRNYGRAANAVLQILQNSPLLRVMEERSAWELSATVDSYRPVPASSGIAARAIGSNYTPTVIAPADEVATTLAIYGEDVNRDITYVRDAKQGLRNLDVWAEKEVLRRLRNFTHKLENDLFNGDGQTNKVTGLLHILDGETDIPGFTGIKRVSNAKDASVDTTPKHIDLRKTASNYEKNLASFEEWFRIQLNTVEDPSAILCAPAMHGVLTTMARKLGTGGTYQSVLLGNVPAYDGIPIVSVHKDSILLDEEDDSDTPLETTSSIYIVSPQEMQLSLLTNSGIHYKEFDWQEGKEQDTEKWEIALRWKIEVPESILRIRNIRIA